MNKLTQVVMKIAKKENKIKNKKELVLMGLSFVIVFATIATTMVVGSVIITKKLMDEGRPEIFINVLLILNFLILLFNSISSTLNSLYYAGDLKVFLRMPIKSIDIVRAKIIQMITTEYQMEVILLAIPIFVYGVLTKANIIFYVYSIIILVLIPVIPIIIAATINAIIMRLTNFIKNKNRLMYIAVIISTIIVSIISSYMSMSTSDFSNNFIFTKPIMEALINFESIEGFKAILVFVLETIVTFWIGTYVISKIYFKGVISTTINGNKRKHNNKAIKINDFKKRNSNFAYLKKEVALITRSPMFMIQCIIVPLFYSFITALILFGIYLYNSSLITSDLFLNIMNSSFGMSLLIIIAQFMYMINFNSIIAVSKEGKNARVIKYIPIDYEKQFKMKIVLGMLLNIVNVFLIVIFYYVCTKNIFETGFLFVILLLISDINEKLKLLIDLKSPQMNWSSEFLMLKQNTNVMNELFLTLAITGIVGILGYMANEIRIFVISIIVIGIIIESYINRYIRKNKNKIFEKIY